MKYSVNGMVFEAIRSTHKTEVKAMRRHKEDGLVHFDNMEGYNIRTNIESLNLVTYHNGYTWFILDATSGIAVSQAYTTYKDAMQRFVNLLANNGFEKALALIEKGRADTMEKFGKYIAAE